MSERENEWKSLSGFSPQNYCEEVRLLLPYLLYKAQKERTEKFWRWDPYGVDLCGLKLPEEQAGEA